VVSAARSNLYHARDQKLQPFKPLPLVFVVAGDIVHRTFPVRLDCRISKGIFITMVGAIAIQFVTVTWLQREDKSLGAVLLVDYLLLVTVAVGLLLMALGTKKLKRIEEV
jgi:hypothetical protein